MKNNRELTNKSRLRIPLLSLLGCVVLGACASVPQGQQQSPPGKARYLQNPNLAIEIPTLSHCTDSEDTTLRLDSREPVVVIVHGCFSSAGRFRSLADVFAFHGQQAICFNYNDRDRLSTSSAELITAIENLSGHLERSEITVIGHSQGGLVSRHALTAERPDRLEAGDTTIRLVSISAPFGGIDSSSHCGSRPLAWFSLGITKLICQLVTGSKYREIPPNSEFINSPGNLIQAVDEHLKIATDESGTCRRYNDRDRCVEDDFVFSLAEQTQPAIESDKNLTSIVVKSGHVEIVGNGETEPTKLIGLFQEQGVLNPTQPGRTEEFSQLMSELYLTGPAE